MSNGYINYKWPFPSSLFWHTQRVSYKFVVYLCYCEVLHGLEIPPKNGDRRCLSNACSGVKTKTWPWSWKAKRPAMECLGSTISLKLGDGPWSSDRWFSYELWWNYFSYDLYIKASLCWKRRICPELCANYVRTMLLLTFFFLGIGTLIHVV